MIIVEYGKLEWWEEYEKEQKRLEEEREQENMCRKCIWGDWKNKFCMFPKCIYRKGK